LADSSLACGSLYRIWLARLRSLYGIWFLPYAIRHKLYATSPVKLIADG